MYHIYLLKPYKPNCIFIVIQFTMNTDTYPSEGISYVSSLYEKYKDDAYMFSKMHHYIINQLPNVLETIKHTHNNRLIHTEEMSNEQDIFIQSFLNNNQYFYVLSTEQFFFYDGLHYNVFNEDDILHHVLTSISKYRQLMSWKQRTKVNIMKRIKEKNLLKSIPESDTIQHVLDLLHPALFPTKTEAKYFLTVLGDNIFKKNQNLIHFIHVKSKPFIRELNNFAQIFVGSNLSQTFKHKYHEHDYTNCRLIKINEMIKM